MKVKEDIVIIESNLKRDKNNDEKVEEIIKENKKEIDEKRMVGRKIKIKMRCNEVKRMEYEEDRNKDLVKVGIK